MPLGDWQFWAVSLAGLAAVILLVRALRPTKPKNQRATLTINRETRR